MSTVRKPFKKTTLLIFALLALVAVEAAVVVLFISRMARRADSRRSSPAPAQSGKYAAAPKVAPKPKPKPSGPRAAPPQFSLPGGVFTNQFTVELKVDAPKAVIRYTLDGSDPEESSPAYSQPIVLAQTTLVRASAFEGGLAPSAIITATFTKLDPSVLEFSSNLPLVILNSYNRYIGPGGYIPSSVRFIGLSSNGRATLSGAADFEGRGEIKRRGFTSLRLPKPSFTFKARNGDGDKLKFSPFGLPVESDWVLYAPYQDKTLIRDALAYELSNQMGRYAPRTRFVELFLARGNAPLTRNDNLGVYVLIEKIKRGKDRVNIAKLDPEDNAEPEITGGYIFKRDHGSMSGGRGWGFSPPRATDDGVGFRTPRDLRLFFVDPAEDELTAAQRNYLARYVTRFEDILHSANFASPTEGYAKYLDVDAFIDHFWLVEMSKNIDAFRYSAYLHKPRNGKITLGPCWDWNLSFGNADYHGAEETHGWYYTWLRDIEICWVTRLREDPEFVQRQIDRWAELRRDLFAPERLLRRVDELATQLQEAQARNFNRWKILNRYVQPNPNTYGTYQGEIQAMKQWIQGRIAWLDRQFLSAPALSTKSGAVSTGTSVTLSGSSGKLYYTLDGTDPRVRGGAVSKTAREYTGPLTIDREVQLFARLRRGDNWSGPTTARFTLEKSGSQP